MSLAPLAARAKPTQRGNEAPDLVNPYQVVVPQQKAEEEEPPAPGEKAAEPDPPPSDAEPFDDDPDFGGEADAPTASPEPQTFDDDDFGDDAPAAAPPAAPPDRVVFGVAGHVAADGRVFFAEPIHPGQKRGDAVSLVVEPELSLHIDDTEHRFTVRPFYRLDPIDPNRSHFDLRKAQYQLSIAGWEAGLGVGQFSWGGLDIHRPSDVVNQIDFVERIDGTEKLGQPYAELGYVGGRAALRLYYLPYFRDRTFQGIQGRLRFPVAVAGDPVYESDFGRWHPGAALRFTIVLGDLDLGLGGFTGLSRDPRFIAERTTGEIIPRYDISHQGSADLQWSLGPVTLKAEGFVRAWSQELHLFGGAGVGLDYTLSDIAESGVDLTFLAEGYYDSRPPEAPVTFFDHDAFGGLRLAFGDIGDTEVSGGVIADVLDATLFGVARAKRRFGDHWVLSLEGRFFRSPPEKLEAGLIADNHLAGRVAYYF
ncbi:MAG: hypothetical protein KC731_33015 [Myxococcales bacterium]|nr:hypothetical protein [Myxococcales bacterium]